jgi:hypothetical protein
MKTIIFQITPQFIKIALNLCLVCVLMLSSCSKETGPVGPQGPKGNANVKNYRLTIATNDWQWESLYKEWYYDFTLLNEASESALYAYVISGDGEEIMPYQSQLTGATTSFSSVLFSATPYIRFKFYNGTTTLTKPTLGQSIRLVVIPPSARKANVDYSNYTDVKSAYNLAD